MSCSVLLSAWPICSEPVTFGGGITIVNGSASRRSGRPALNAPASSQTRGHAAFDIGGLVGFFDHGNAITVGAVSGEFAEMKGV